MITVLIQITAQHFVAGLIAEQGRVIQAAPVIRYMIGWDGRQVVDYCARKRWQCARVPT